MNPPPAALARSGKVGSTLSKTYSEIAGIFERKGSTLDPAGMMWSVVMLSPTFSSNSPLSVSGTPGWMGSGLMFGPRTTSTVLPIHRRRLDELIGEYPAAR